MGWLRNRRRRKLLAEPFPAKWEEILRRNMWQYATLPEPDRGKLRDNVRLLAAEKNWEGCGGLKLTDEVRVTVAGYAALPALAFGIDCYHRVITILVYPDAFVAPAGGVTKAGVAWEGEADLAGEAWHEGVVIVAWADVLEAGRREGDGMNVVIHEFAHQLDMLDWWVDGEPPMANRELAKRWPQVMKAEYEQLVRQSEAGRATLLDPYGATDPGEFFAVASEYFFEKPVQLRNGHPKLYGVLSEFYGQDPARRNAR